MQNEDALFVSERRRAIIAHAHRIGRVAFCGLGCGQTLAECRCGTTPAQGVWTERAICVCGQPIVGNEWHMCVDTVRRFGDETTTPVSLPTAQSTSGLGVEETRGLERPCSFCRRPIRICNDDPQGCITPPSGWRDRPPLL